MIDFIKKNKDYLIIFVIFVVFIFIRLPGVDTPYHQDEYKWVMYSHPEIIPAGSVPHPPLTELIYTKLGPLVGDNNFRLIPLGFSTINLFLLFYLSKFLFGKKEAFIITSLFAVSFYSILASLMVDVDGAVMPFFALLLFIGYFKFKSSGWKDYKWLSLLIIGGLGGFLVKLSGILPFVALAIDFAIEMKVFSDRKKILKYILSGLGIITGLILILVLARFIFPFFKLEYSIKYWKHFAESSSFLGRGWFQTFIQFVKSILYLSPLIIIPTIFVDREIFSKTRAFFIFIILGLFFYLFLFDFSIGALDRYFEFLVIPLVIISGLVFYKHFDKNVKDQKTLLFSIIIALLIFAFQFFQHSVPSLHPKSEWIGRILSFNWDFLYVFSGGSGPMPFYVSFGFIAFFWLLSIFLGLFGRFSRNVEGGILICILVFGLTYNLVFVEEYMFGKINGSAKKVLSSSMQYIEDNSIKNIVVYNDNGGWDVRQTGQYNRRMYATPAFESSYREFLSGFRGNILYINIPRVESNSFYSDYLSSCSALYEVNDKYIKSQVLNCSKLKK